MNFKNIESFGFITNPLNVKFSKAIEIIPGHYFRKAKDNEIKCIRKFLAELLGKNFYGYPYEVDRVLEKVNSVRKFTRGFMPRVNSEYFTPC